VSETDTGSNTFIARTFAYSSGRVIALCRLVWASVFLLVVWLDPEESVQVFRTTYFLLGGYTLWAAAIAIMVWRNWWLDFRLGLSLHAVDIVVFVVSVVMTEGVSADFTSPFLAFFAFLILAAAIRWGWQSALLTGLVVTLLYSAVGAAFIYAGFEFDAYRFGRRITYMSLLALVMAWFALRRGEQRVLRFQDSLAQVGRGLPLREALSHAVKHTFARAGVIGWADFEEPFTRLHSLGNVTARELLGPKEFNPERGFGRAVRIFDRRQGRTLQAAANGQVTGHRGQTNEEFAAVCMVDEALAVPISGSTGRGEILLVGIDGLSRDHVQLGGPLAREIGAAFDRHTANELANKMVASRTREAIARDLHDSVVQTLAGAALRVEALRTRVQQGGDLEPEIDAVQGALREEQTHVRSLIARLRKGSIGEGAMEAASVFRVLLQGLEARWNVVIRFESRIEPVAIASWMAHELDGILREAVANAVRHGGATEVCVELTGTSAGLTVAINDNGHGFAAGADVRKPRSISDRVDRWGGTLSVQPSSKGVHLQIALPLEDVM
jgi:signal transduction histidine kinase